MIELEFIIALTEHRFLGMIFQPFLVEKNEQFYSVVQFVKPRDFNDSNYSFSTYEKELVTLIEKYSDEKLMRKFSRAASVSEFYTTIRSGYFEKTIQPFIEQQMGLVANILMLSPVRLFKKDAKYSNLYEEDIVDVQPFYGRPQFYFERTENETRYQLKLFLEKKEIKITSSNLNVITNKPLLLLYRNQLIAFEKLTAKKLSPFFEKEFIVVPNSIEEKYYPGFVLNTVRDFDVIANGFQVEDAKVEHCAILSLELNLQYEPVLVMQYEYGNERFLINSKRKKAVSLIRENSTFIFRRTIRDTEWENDMLNKIKKIGLIEDDGNFVIKGAKIEEPNNSLFFMVNWLNKNKATLSEMGVKVVQNKLEKKYFTGEQKLEFQTNVKGDWFDVYAVVRFGEFEVPFIKLKKYILNDIREFELPNGEIVILPEEWFARYKGLLPFAKGNGNEFQVEKHHFTLLKDTSTNLDAAFLEKLKELETTEIKPVELPLNLNAKLRNYQEEGFQWMYQLQQNGFGGCLADDMGLGKTLQTLVLLLKSKRAKTGIIINDPFVESNQPGLFVPENHDEETQNASLIVVPTSLVHNWDNEIRKFTPDLKTYKYVGSQRKKAVEISKIARFYDVILTTYGTVRNDRKLLMDTEFHYVILDESQTVKNPTSKTYKTVLDLRSKHRLVITGTPIENSLSDLWSQMNFLNAGILGNLAFFKKTFITPIEKKADELQQQKLQAMIRPFILRRKKEEVAKDLPPLMEQVMYCEMVKEQAKKYEHEKSVIRNAILENIEEEGMEKSSFIILQGLTKLRQLANHPALLEKETDDGSGKFEEIFRMLENVVAENHKVLIFSTFVKHLDLLKKRIEDENWKYSILTGKTTKREDVIQEFQLDPENHIFLISLKAGGVGLNLTEADYVFIIDPWWNPASENQAINRAHRIGQDKHVFVYRFISQDTIEEKIQLLKERKSALADKFINSNNPLQKITKEEIVELFE